MQHQGPDDQAKKNTGDEQSLRRYLEGRDTQKFNQSSPLLSEPTFPLTIPRRRKKIKHLFWVTIVTIGIAAALIIGGKFLFIKPVTPPLPFKCTTDSSDPIKLTMYYDSETQDWTNDVIGDFNNRCHGRIKVEPHAMSSGQAMQEILAGQIQPDIWNPAGKIWLELLNAKWQKNHPGTSVVSTDALSLVQSPIVIAMWKPMAEALGWPQKPIWWKDIAALSTNAQGWAAYGHPEWGNFKFGHTDPYYSNSGLDAILAENYVAADKKSRLTSADVNNSATQGFVTNIESSVIHYGDDTNTITEEMFHKGPSYLSAVVTNESQVAEANAGTKYKNLANPVVAIYPLEGTFISDYPFTIPQEGWVTPVQKSAAQLLRSFMLAPPQQKKALHDYFFRPGTLSSSDALGAPLDSAHGVSSTVPLMFIPPGPDPSGTAIDTWSNERNRSDVLLLLDSSGSMNDSIGGDSKLAKAKQGLLEFVSLMRNSDDLGMTIFNDQETILTPVNQIGAKRQNISTLISNINASGNTLLYRTIADQVANLQAQPTKDIKAVIALTDGINNDMGSLSLDKLIENITPIGNNAGEGVKVYTIAYGNPADINADALIKIAAATGGQEYNGTPQSILQVYGQITTQTGGSQTI